MVEEEIEDATSLSAPVALSVPVAGISPMMLEV
jgi:hypothetical protein